ncbi:MAG: DUF5615 family PIN-like protein [Acidobacteriota bacterium]
MRIKLYIDEDAMSHALVQGLRARGLDVITVFDAGMVGESDESQLEYATAQGRTLYTFNVGDFCRLHESYLSQGREHGGIIVVYRQRYSVGEQLKRLLSLVDRKTADEMRNHLEFL